MVGVLGARLGNVLTVDEYPPSNRQAAEENVPIDAGSSAFGADAEKVSYDELNEIAPERWDAFRGNAWRWGAEPDPRDPDLVMTMGKFWPEERQKAFHQRTPSMTNRLIR